MHDPQVCADGLTYEGRAIREWMDSGRDVAGDQPETRASQSHTQPRPSLCYPGLASSLSLPDEALAWHLFCFSDLYRFTCRKRIGTRSTVYMNNFSSWFKVFVYEFTSLVLDGMYQYV